MAIGVAAGVAAGGVIVDVARRLGQFTQRLEGEVAKTAAIGKMAGETLQAVGEGSKSLGDAEGSVRALAEVTRGLSAAKQEAERGLQALREKVATVEGERGTAQDALRQKESELAEVRAELKAERATTNDLRAALARSEAANAGLATQLREAQEAVTHARALVETQRAEIAQLKAEIEGINTAAAACLAEMERVDARLASTAGS